MIERATAMVLRLLLTMTAFAAPLSGQDHPNIPRPGASRLRLAVPLVVDTVRHQRPIHETRALTGAMLGALPIALLTLAVGPGFCEDTDSNGRGHDCLLRTLMVVPLAAAPTGFVGAMIGAATPKGPDEIRPSRGSYWKEVAVGLGGFSAIGGALVGHRDCRDFSTGSCFGEALTGALSRGLVNAALGGMFGSLIPKR